MALPTGRVTFRSDEVSAVSNDGLTGELRGYKASTVTGVILRGSLLERTSGCAKCASAAKAIRCPFCQSDMRVAQTLCSPADQAAGGDFLFSDTPRVI
jgi:hypothetical protein